MNKTLRLFLTSHGLFLALLVGSAAGHVCLGWVTFVTTVAPQLPPAHSGRTSVSVQLVAGPAAASPTMDASLAALAVPPDARPVAIPTPDLAARVPAPRPPQTVTSSLARVRPEEMMAELAVAERVPAAAPAHRARPAETPQPEAARRATPLARQHAAVGIAAGQNEGDAPQTLLSRASTGSQVPPTFLSRPEPVYPPDLLLQGVEGAVQLLVSVDRDGRVAAAAVHRSSGHPAMDQSALDAVQQWTFSPALRGHVRVQQTVIVPIHFRIRR